MNVAPASASSSRPPLLSESFLHRRSILSWIGLAAVLALYLFCLLRFHPTNFFGQMEDDSIYFSSAREIAAGRGYIMPSIPGAPRATKYPILYPWILSWVWRLNPHFPANLSWAVTANAMFGLLYLITAFVFLVRLKGISIIEALFLTGFCALHPVTMALSVNIMSDVPFAACALGACVLAAAVRNEHANTISLLSGFLSGCSVLLRSLGIAVAFGLFVAIMLRNGYRRALVFILGVLPFAAVFISRALLFKSGPAPLAGFACGGSWHMTWLYYTSYIAYWKADTLSNHVFWPVVKNGVWQTLTQPGSYFVDPTGFRPGLLAVLLLVFLSGMAIRGLFRQMQYGGRQPIHLALAFYLLPVIVWDYSNPQKFLIPFLPLLAAGMLVEVRHLAREVVFAIREQKADTQVAAFCFCAIGCALVFGGLISWHRGMTTLSKESQLRGSLLEEKLQGYAWIRHNTTPAARVAAYEDASLFLYTGRQAVRPIIFSPAGYYRPEILDSELACLVSSAKPIGPGYWFVADDDFAAEWEPASSRGKSSEKLLESRLRPAFKSSEGRVRIYELGLGAEDSHMRLLQ
jgi:hypothetical protein